MKSKPSGGNHMKTPAAIVLTFVLTASLLVGCGCTNRKIENTSAPTVLPTNEEIWNTTEETTRFTTQATTEPVQNTTRPTIDNGNGGIDDSLNTMDTAPTETSPEGRIRRMMPDNR